jgi:hypothetical protein
MSVLKALSACIIVFAGLPAAVATGIADTAEFQACAATYLPASGVAHCSTL